MSIIYKIFNDSGLTALINYIKATRAKAVSNEAAIDGLGEDLAGLSGEVVNALGNKQDKLTFDTTPTAGSTNPITSGGVKSYVDDNIPDPGLQVVTTAGTGSAYTATVSGIDSLTVGASFIMIPNVVSTSVSPTLNVNGLGAKTIRLPISTNTSTTVAASDASWLAAGKPIQVTYNGTYWVADLTRPYATDLYGTVPVTNGGTGATTAEQARINLGISDFGSKSTSVTLTTSGWALSGDRYYQTISVADVTADTPVVIVDCALNGTDLDADVTVLEAWQGPSANNVAQGAGTLTFYSYDLPTVNIPVNVGVC